MRTVSIVILLIILPSVCLAEEYPPIEFHTDGIIRDGDAYSYVQVFDNATVDMTGGLIDIGGLWLYDNSTFNAYGGSMEWSEVAVLDSGTLNLYYLQSTPRRITAGGELVKINVYGNNFEYIKSSSDWLLNGNWANNAEFSLLLRGPDTRNYVVLHEIPEPSVIALMLLGALGIVKKNR